MLHGVSVGEVKLARVVLRALAARGAALEPLVTSTTPAGLAEAERSMPDARRAIYPIDVAGCAERFLRRAQPSSVVLVELELWPLFLRAAAARGVPVAVVNGRISERTAGRYRWLPELTARRLGAVSLFAMQSDAYAERLRSLGVPRERVVVCGNAKLDGLPDPTGAPDAELARLLAIDGRVPVLVGGSTHEPEEAILARAVARLRAEGLPSLRLVIVPRHVERADAIARAVAPILGEPERLSRLRAESRAVRDAASPVVVDTVGDLEKVYRFASVAFVGGSLQNLRGGQNVLEPAALGVPVLHGPDVPTFADAAELLAAAGASEVVRDEAALAAAVARLARDSALARSRGDAGRAAIAPHRGAAARIAEELASRGFAGRSS